MGNEGFWYLASPYSKHPKGPQFAFKKISKQTKLLLKNGTPTYHPITHNHPIYQHNNTNPNNHNTQPPTNKTTFQHAKGIIVCMLESWQDSYGVNWEIEEFAQMDKPAIFMTPDIVPEVLMND